ncbi:glycerol kinase GlpK [Gaoshiqia sediminis]|uniref:glycerol kinase n=1 Tax=Gaoshiqia sediminis TaxID=2986998 RepID=A0AA42C979_9BACT|nr:glycerol kinase GlpK [Gaoshiqia sediminis]MCW0481775.1 glycerol kinase GlpK [Gaoshiqia sediminis]
MEKDGKYILAIDQSTSATKAILFDKCGRLKQRTTIPHRQFYPHAGFVEHDPVEIFNNTCEAMRQVMTEQKVTEDELAGIAITNQRETALIWDKNTGLPVANAAVWQCQRGAQLCLELKTKGYEDLIRSKTGLLIDPYFSASKLSWIMQNTPGLKEQAKKGELLLGTMDSWLLWKLTGGKVHATDYSNACRTMLFNIHTLDWDNELIELFGLYRNMFPEVRFSDEVAGHTEPGILFHTQKPIAGLIGDSHGALFGQTCFKTGMAKATYGTGSSIMMNIGTKALDAPQGLVTSIGYSCGKQIHYVFEGNIHCTGDTLNWLKNEVGLISHASETESLANSVPDNNNVYFVPAFVGLGAPYWDNQARACLSGMGRNTTKAHIVRAALESIAFQVNDLISLMEEKGGIQLQELRVDGGPTRNKFLMQFQSDLLQQEVSPSEIEEASALGSAYMAGLAFGFWGNPDELEQLRVAGKTYQPKQNKDEIAGLVTGWQKAVERARLH